MSKRNKVLLGLAGVTGIGVTAWRAFFPWLDGEELQTLGVYFRFGKAIFTAIRNRTLLIDIFEEHAVKMPNHPFVIFESKIYSYGFVNEMANRVANFAGKLNLKTGDTVAMMIGNEPSFIWTFLGFQKLGIITAFINYHLTSTPLAHSINASDAKLLILGNDDSFLEAIQEVRSDLKGIQIYVQGKDDRYLPSGYSSLDQALLRCLPVPVCTSVREPLDVYSTMCYIYTSGTTGLPKPAIFNHWKGIVGMRMWTMLDTKLEDRVYVVTPLYHSSAVIGVFNSINFGATVVLKRKFSARDFFDDCRKYDVTIIQYIGELCRYLLHQPENVLDGVHKIKVAYGNGLRKDIWEKFQKRFKIPWIIEIYGATEGVSGFLNLSNKPGSVGRFTPLMKLLTRQKIVKYDPDLEQPVRDENGRCIHINPGEGGLVLGPIPPAHTGFYKGPKEMDEKKTLVNVFQDGDLYFNSGDLVYWDKDYYVYFSDRLGDTFRWKGENVSTMEIANVLSGLKFIRDVTVYGVKVPGYDGRAGMAAILLKENQELTPDILSQIYRHCRHNIPAYARPLFLRIVDVIPLTTTMKHRKVELVKEGFDPNVISQPLYFRDETKQAYFPLTSASYAGVVKSKL